MKFYFALLSGSYRQRFKGAAFGDNFHPLLAFASFFNIFSTGFLLVSTRVSPRLVKGSTHYFTRKFLSFVNSARGPNGGVYKATNGADFCLQFHVSTPKKHCRWRTEESNSSYASLNVFSFR